MQTSDNHNKNQTQQHEVQQMSYFEEEKEDVKELEQQKKNVRYLAFCFLTLFTSYNPTQNLISTLYKQQGYQHLGLISLLFIFVIFSIASLFAKMVIGRFSYHYVFVISSLGYLSYIVSGILVCQCTDSLEEGVCSPVFIISAVIICSALCGVSAATLWIGQGGYMEIIFSIVKVEKGTLSGIFWSIRQSSHLVGNILAMVIVNTIDNNLYFFIIMGIISFSSTVMFYFIARVDSKNYKSRSDLTQNLVNSNNIQIENQAIPVSQQIKKVMALIKTMKFQPFIFFNVLGGVSLAFAFGFQRNLVKQSIEGDEKLVSQNLSYVLIPFGICQYLGGKISGKLADKYSPYNLATLGTLIILFGLLLCFVGLLTKSYIICFFIGSIFGFIDCYINNISQVISNKDYKGQVEVFQAQRFISAISIAITQIFLLILDSLPEYTFLVFVFVVTLISNFIVSLFPQLSQTIVDQKSLQSKTN